ncbi:glycine zipper family protein [Aquabacterium humicola]|uniref:glycine zipper family protein n=1 Tax=Aquabacterium humicola TaxID=3237377 RepID=UPI0025431203|nr:glycine zipper family protein [Rubrivivax pictus]
MTRVNGLLVLLPALVALPVQAQAPAGARGATGQVVYPARGQSAHQVDQDRYACHDWARQQSGFDPMQPSPTAATPALPAATGDTGATASLAGIAQGAAGGAALAEIAERDAGKGAAVGVFGAGLRQRAQQQQALAGQQAAQQQQLALQQQQQQSARAQQRGLYERAFAACMEARGYVVK